MLYVRVKSYYQDGRFTGCEHLYLTDNQCKALERFHAEYPAHNDCICVAEYIDSDDPKQREYFEVCCRCGCVH